VKRHDDVARIGKTDRHDVTAANPHRRQHAGGAVGCSVEFLVRQPGVRSDQGFAGGIAIKGGF
jgi:hypothetical protein